MPRYGLLDYVNDGFETRKFEEGIRYVQESRRKFPMLARLLEYPPPACL